MSKIKQDYKIKAEISKNPWLYDDTLTDEERIYWKLKGQCHACRYDVRHHKDDCMYSDVQLHFQQIENELYDNKFTFYGVNLDALAKALAKVKAEQEA